MLLLLKLFHFVLYHVLQQELKMMIILHLVLILVAQKLEILIEEDHEQTVNNKLLYLLELLFSLRMDLNSLSDLLGLRLVLWILLI